MTDLRVGIVGCGAVTARSHLPALNTLDGIQVTALADPQIERARNIASRFEVPKAVVDYRELLEDVEALILALPHHLHAPIGEEVLRAGKHVLMEKPLANTLGECDRLIDAARQGAATLAVGQVRRYMLAYMAVKEWLDTDLLGDLTGFEAEEGGVYNWPVVSDFFFRPEMSGGGVLMDTGAHVVDALLWWLGDLEVFDYSDDNAGGVEADCSLQVKTASGVGGSLTLSRIRALKNTCIFRGSRADLEVGLLTNQAKLVPRGLRRGLCGAFGNTSTGPPQSTLDLFRRQAEEWLKLIRGEPAAIATAEEGRRTVRIISDCYAQKQQVHEPWRQISTETVGGLGPWGRR